MVTYSANNNDSLWKAIADEKRRHIIDELAKGPKTTGELVELFPTIGRTAVLKHIDILQNADLIRIKREGRVRWNYINTSPLKKVCGQWLWQHIDGITSSALQLKKLGERK